MNEYLSKRFGIQPKTPSQQYSNTLIDKKSTPVIAVKKNNTPAPAINQVTQIKNMEVSFPVS
jgi:hypothetical protein